jgi:uncharacterized protein
LKIYFESIKDECLHWEGTLPIDKERLDFEVITNDEAEVSIEIQPINEFYQIKGRMIGDLTVPCSRCMEDADFKYNFTFELYLIKEPLEGSEEEIELQRDDLKFSFNHGDHIDLVDVISEQLSLKMPMKILCSPDCKGICSICGENLNFSQCKCEEENKKDSPFAKLAILKKNIE